MENVKKYKLGNRSNEYALAIHYAGWKPEGIKDWRDVLFPWTTSPLEGREFVLVNPKDINDKLIIIARQQISRGAFDLDFLIEEFADRWSGFLIISTKDKPEEEFIIPLEN